MIKKWVRRPERVDIEGPDTVRCDKCGQIYRWRLSKGMSSIICATCTMDLCAKPRSQIRDIAPYSRKEWNI